MINLNDLTPQQKVYLTALAWLAVLILVVWLIIKPLVAQIKNDGQELAQKKQAMESFYADWQTLEKTQKDYQIMQSEINGLPALLPANDALKFIVLIEKFAQATNNLPTVAVVASDPAAKQKIDGVNFQVSLRGKFPDLVKFLVYLENAPYYSYIKSLDARRLTSKENPEATDGLTTVLNITALQ